MLWPGELVKCWFEDYAVIMSPGELEVFTRMWRDKMQVAREIAEQAQTRYRKFTGSQ